MTDIKDFDPKTIRICFEADCPAPDCAERRQKSVCTICMNHGTVKFGVPIIEFMAQVLKIADERAQAALGKAGI